MQPPVDESVVKMLSVADYDTERQVTDCAGDETSYEVLRGVAQGRVQCRIGAGGLLYGP